MISTRRYKVAASVIGRRAASAMAWRWLWALALPVVGLIVAGLYDWRMYIVAVALALIVYPFVVMLAYYYVALSPQSVRAVLPQQADFGPDGSIVITYYPMVDEGSAPGPRRIERVDVTDAEIDGKYLAIKLVNGAEVIIPADAFGSNADLYSVLDTYKKLETYA